nr:SufS family cysteine desulfurase [Oceanococcus sp. HetDA_MAG_MS8]
MSFDVESFRSCFPALRQEVNGHPLHYFDNAATTLKPQVVVDAVRQYDDRDTANVHRGLHTLSARATTAYEAARTELANWFSVPEREVVYTRGTTEAINIVAQCWARGHLKPGDDIVISALEHHANIVPWQIVTQQTGAQLRVIPATPDGRIDLDVARDTITPATKLLAISGASNAIGTILPVAELIQIARAQGALVLVDGAQIAVRQPLDLNELGADFFCCSGHKMFGPTGTGMLWGRAELLEAMTPWMGGGDMIEEVAFEQSTYADIPWKFEAGTPNISGFIGWAAAIRFLQEWDLNAICAHEDQILHVARDGMEKIPSIRILGPREHTLPLVSFVMDGAHEQDIATLLDENGIAVRTGHHCAMPLLRSLGVRGTVRASFSAYNTEDEVLDLVNALQRVGRLLCA